MSKNDTFADNVSIISEEMSRKAPVKKITDMVNCISERISEK